MALPFVACNKEELTEPVSKGEQISISVKATAEDLANLTDTKTYIDGMNVLWGENEQMSIFLINGNTAASATSTGFIGEGEAEAIFAFNFNSEDIPANGPYTYGGIYPASADKGLTKDQTTDRVELPATQNSTATSYDPAAYIMVAKPESFETVQTEWIASYRRATALNKITLTGISEDIASVAITVPEGKYLAGRRYIDVATGESGEIYKSGFQTNTITVNYATALPHTAADVWFTSWGVEVAEGEAVTVKVTTVTNKAYTKTFNARAEGIKFTENYLNTLAVDMSDAIAEETGLPLPFTEDFSEVTGGDNTSVDDLTQFDITGSVFSATGGAIRLGTNSANGKITTKSALDLSKPFTVIVYGTGWADDERTLEISAGSQSKTITFNTDKELNTQYVEGQYVYFDAETDMTKVTFTNKDGRVILNSIEIVSGEWIPTPEIMVIENSKTVNYDAESVEFSYITMGITGDITVTETSDVDNIVSSASAADGIVSVSLVPNTEEREKTATIELSYEGAEPVTLTIIQKASLSTSAVTIILDAATQPCPEFPTGDQKEEQTYTIEGYSWTFSPSSGNKFRWYENDFYLLWGKQGAYILMPAVPDKHLTSVTILTGKNASKSVKVGVYTEDGASAVSGGEAIQLNKQGAEFSWSLTGTENNTAYQLRVCSAHNAQLQKLTLIYE